MTHMMVFITRYCKKCLINPWNIYLGIFFLLLNVNTTAYAGNIQIREARLTVLSEKYYLNGEMDIQINSTLEEALQKGVPLTFIAEFELVRPRNYWFDQTMYHNQFTIKLSYDILTQHYIVNSNGQYQIYLTLNEAKKALSHFRDWFAFEQNVFKKRHDQYVANLRVRLDSAQLPKPLQVNALISRDWDFVSPWFQWSFSN